MTDRRTEDSPTDKQAGQQTNADRQTGTLDNRRTNRPIDKHMPRQTDRQTNIYT